MADFVDADLNGALFERVDLRSARFERVRLDGARLRNVNLTDARLHGADLSRVVMRGVDIHGDVENLRINDADVAPLITAELDRRHPERAKMRPTTPAGFREGWDVVERLWAGTVERARRLPPDQLHESVDGEWSFIETLRHLVFATDARWPAPPRRSRRPAGRARAATRCASAC